MFMSPLSSSSSKIFLAVDLLLPKHSANSLQEKGIAPLFIPLKRLLK